MQKNNLFVKCSGGGGGKGENRADASVLLGHLGDPRGTPAGY